MHVERIEVTAMSRSILVSVLIGGALAGAGCADYAYRANSATGTPTPLASYSIPPASPQGQVQLRSPGVQPLPTPEVRGERGLHVVLIVTNDGQRPWAIDTREETVALPDGAVYAPTLALAGGTIAAARFVEVPAGGRRSVDLYYALPAGHARERDLPRFVARWRIDTAHGPVQGRATFQRVNLAGPTMPCGPHPAEYCLAGYGA